MSVTIQTGLGGSSSSGGITTIASGSMPAAATLDLTSIPATYAALHLRLTGISTNTATRHPRIQVDTDNGASFDTAAGNYVGSWVSSAAALALITEATLCGNIADQVAAATWAIDVVLMGYQGGPHANFFSYANNGSNEVYSCSGFYKGSTSAINALRVLISGTGSFDAGTYALYGVS